MNDVRRDLTARYVAALQKYLAQETETNLQQAYELGRTAIAEGLGVLDMARLHQQALIALLVPDLSPDAWARVVKAAETYFMEILSPFEATHRGFRDTCEQLRLVNETLEKRNLELRTSNRELGMRERQFEEAQRLAQMGSWEWDVRTNRMSWSDELFRIHGVTPGQLDATFETYLDFVHPADRARARNIIESALRDRGPFVFDERIVRADGVLRTLHTRGEIILDEQGEPLRLVGFCQDITDRRRAEEMWKRYESIVNTSREFLTLIDRRYRYEAANDPYCSAHGLSREEILGRKASDLWGNRVFRTVIKGYLDQCFLGQDVHYQAWFAFRVIGHRFYSVSYYPYYRDGVVTHAIVVTRDITERRRAEEGLVESESKFRSVVESARDGIITGDGKGKIVFANRAAEAIFGCARDELLGKSLTRLMPELYRSARLRGLKRLRAGSVSQLIGRTLELRGRRRDGSTFPLELSLATWQTKAETFYTGMVRDITERKQAEESLRESKEHFFELFQQARAMEENLRQLSSRVLNAQEEERKRISRELHDEVGQALTAINVNLALLKKQSVIDRGTLNQKINDTQGLIEQITGTVHRFARELRPAALDDLGLVPALRSYIQTFAERANLRTRFRASPAVESLDAERKTVIYRITQESLNNIAKHSRATRVGIAILKRRDRVHLEIKDNGQGFQTEGKSPEKGKRLGLLGMKERVRLVNGVFTVDSEPGRGTAVRVDIPFKTRGRATAVESRPAREGRMSATNRKE
jgi:PAS domain S-box-containing protein